MITIQKRSDRIVFDAYVQPRSSSNAIVGCHDQALKIKLTSPPVGGAANKQCIQLLAKQLGLPKSDLSIAAGHRSRRKKISIALQPGSAGKADAGAIIQRLRKLTQQP
jgi:hypothetical protein